VKTHGPHGVTANAGGIDIQVTLTGAGATIAHRTSSAMLLTKNSVVTPSPDFVLGMVSSQRKL